MRELLVDYIPFEVSKHQIQESLKENDGKLVVKGVLQRADAKNQNGRVYPKDILTREAKNYAEGYVKQKRALGELDHPDSSVVNLQNVSHNITEMHFEGDNLLGTVEILTTPSGNILRELFKNGIKLGMLGMTVVCLFVWCEIIANTVVFGLRPTQVIFCLFTVWRSLFRSFGMSKDLILDTPLK